MSIIKFTDLLNIIDLPNDEAMYMFKWLLLIIVVGVFFLWLKRGKEGHDISDPEVKEIDQQRFYVDPSKNKDERPKDDQSNNL